MRIVVEKTHDPEPHYLIETEEGVAVLQVVQIITGRKVFFEVWDYGAEYDGCLGTCTLDPLTGNWMLECRGIVKHLHPVWPHVLRPVFDLLRARAEAEVAVR